VSRERKKGTSLEHFALAKSDMCPPKFGTVHLTHENARKKKKGAYHLGPSRPQTKTRSEKKKTASEDARPPQPLQPHLRPHPLQRCRPHGQGGRIHDKIQIILTNQTPHKGKPPLSWRFFLLAKLFSGNLLTPLLIHIKIHIRRCI